MTGHVDGNVVRGPVAARSVIVSHRKNSHVACTQRIDAVKAFRTAKTFISSLKKLLTQLLSTYNATATASVAEIIMSSRRLHWTTVELHIAGVRVKHLMTQTTHCQHYCGRRLSVVALLLFCPCSSSWPSSSLAWLPVACKHPTRSVLMQSARVCGVKIFATPSRRFPRWT